MYGATRSKRASGSGARCIERTTQSAGRCSRLPVLLISFLVPVCIAAAQPRAEPAATDSLQRPDPRGALLRSAVLPGWGQYYNGKPWKALGFGAAAAGFLTAALVEHRSPGRAQSPEERRDRAGRRNTRFFYLGLTTTLAALDAYVDAHLANFKGMAVVARPGEVILKTDIYLKR